MAEKSFTPKPQTKSEGTTEKKPDFRPAEAKISGKKVKVVNTKNQARQVIYKRQTYYFKAGEAKQMPASVKDDPKFKSYKDFKIKE